MTPSDRTGCRLSNCFSIWVQTGLWPKPGGWPGRLDRSCELVTEVTWAAACSPVLRGEGHIASFTRKTFTGLPSRRHAGTLGTTELRNTTESTIGPRPSDQRATAELSVLPKGNTHTQAEGAWHTLRFATSFRCPGFDSALLPTHLPHQQQHQGCGWTENALGEHYHLRQPWGKSCWEGRPGESLTESLAG